MKRLIYISPLILFSACADELETTNKILTSTITSPAAFANVSGEVQIKTLITPEDEFASLEILIDGDTVATLSENPATYVWQTNELEDAHTLLAIAKNKDGDSYQSEKVTVYIDETSQDTENPIVNITSPASFSTIDGNVTIKATATDDSGIERVIFYTNGDSLSQVTNEPYTYIWDTNGISGTFSITARAYDTEGNFAEAYPVSVNVNPQDETAPIVNITSPASFSTIDGNVTIKATATDDSGIERVIFYTNGDSLSQVTNEPYTYIWDTNGISGTFSITARAYDTEGNFAEAYPVSVTVNPEDVFAPTVYISNPANFDEVEGIVNLRASASDNKGVENVVFYVDSDSVGIDSEAPYEYSWNTNGLNGTFAITAKATDLSGNFSFAFPVSVSVEEIIPLVQILSPGQFEILQGQANVINQIEEIGSVDSLQFFVDGVIRNTFLQNFGQFAFNTNTLPNGNHTFLVRTFAGEQTQNSQVVTVVIQN